MSIYAISLISISNSKSTGSCRIVKSILVSDCLVTEVLYKPKLYRNFLVQKSFWNNFVVTLFVYKKCCKIQNHTSQNCTHLCCTK